MPTREELKMLQALPLDVKIRKTQQRIREWVEHYGEDGVYVSFSGGKDSAVLLDIVRKMYPGIEAVFVNTGLEYPEIVEFVKQHENVTILRPKKNFKQVLTECGYPVIGKQVCKAVDAYRRNASWALDILNGISHTTKEKNGYIQERYGKWNYLVRAPFRISDKCCVQMKERPLCSVKKHPIIGTMAEESKRREAAWVQTGCNSFREKGTSKPLSFWTNNDILTYIHRYKPPIASVYGDVVPDDREEIDGQMNLYDLTGDYQGCKFRTTGCDRSGCMFCLFGAQIEKGEGRLERMKHTHPKRYEYVMGGGEFDNQGMWIPNNKGLGFKFVVDWLNENGNLHIKY